MSENPVLNLARQFFGAGEEVPVKDRRIYTRDQLVRAIIAQQWAVAIALWAPLYSRSAREWQHRADCGLGPDETATDDEVRDYVERNAERWAYAYTSDRQWAPIADLPCAHDVVEGMEKP